MELANKRVLVTGGSGFLGSYVCESLHNKYGLEEVFVPRSRDYDLTREQSVQTLYEDFGPEVVIHLAAVVGGIGANQRNPGKFYYDNLVMGAHLMEYGRQFGLDKFVALGTICSYPEDTPVPFKEEHLWDGYPEETNAPYGLAKKMMLVQSEAYREQYDFNSIFLLPVNLYGPRDNFDLEDSHVIPALIRKFDEAKRNNNSEVTLWGTGEPTREFLYVEDAADGILKATTKYNRSEPVNLGAGFEISIRELAEKIRDRIGFDGEIAWDRSKPDGQPRRRLDTSRAKEYFDFKASTEFEAGLEETISWYRDHRSTILNQPAKTGFQRKETVTDYVKTAP